MRFRDIVESAWFDGLRMKAHGFEGEIQPGVVARVKELESKYDLGAEVYGSEVDDVSDISFEELVTMGMNHDANGIDTHAIKFRSVGRKYTLERDGFVRGIYTHEWDKLNRRGTEPNYDRLKVSRYLMAVHSGITVEMYTEELSKGLDSKLFEDILRMNPYIPEDLRLLLEIK